MGTIKELIEERGLKITFVRNKLMQTDKGGVGMRYSHAGFHNVITGKTNPQPSRAKFLAAKLAEIMGVDQQTILNIITNGRTEKVSDDVGTDRRAINGAGEGAE